MGILDEWKVTRAELDEILATRPSARGYLFGFVGLLVAVPLAATIGVLVRFALHRYLESSLYTGGRA